MSRELLDHERCEPATAPLLQDEGGVTDISLHNGRTLLAEHGLPNLVELVAHDPGEHETRVEWIDMKAHDRPPRKRFTFTGFAWGYGGTGPHGLREFLSWLGIDLDMRDVVKLPAPSLTPPEGVVVARWTRRLDSDRAWDRAI